VLSLAGTGQPAVAPFLSYFTGIASAPSRLTRTQGRLSIARTWPCGNLRTIGCKASGFISAEDLVPTGRSETGAHNYDQVILATGR
jgi:hypothetical protein